MINIHQRIKELRCAKQMSMETLGGLVGVSWQTVQQWEREGGTAPKRSRLPKVAEVLGTSVEFLTSGTLTSYTTANTSHHSVSEPSADPRLNTIVTAWPLLPTVLRESWADTARRAISETVDRKKRA